MNRPVTVGMLLICVLVTIALSLGGAFAVSAVLDTPGPRGVTGHIGVQGIPGERGPRGYRGRRGPSGFNGANGANGATIVREEACSNDLEVPLPYC